MTIDKETKEYILENIQERLDEMFWFVDFPDYISACGFEESEEEWAQEHIGVHVVVSIIED